MTTASSSQEKIRWLLVLLSILAIAVLTLIFYLISAPNSDPPFQALIIAVIPSLIAALIAIPVIYLLFRRKGIQFQDQLSVEELEAILQRSISPKATFPGLHAFYPSFRDVPWKDYLSDSRISIDIVVNYWDSWTAHYHEAIRDFLQRPGAKLRLFVPDPRSASLVKELTRLYPQTSEDSIREKIMKTGSNVRQAVEDAGGERGQFEFYYVPHYLNYALQVLDAKYLVLSNYDMFRQNRIGAPAFILDLTSSEHLRSYWTNELTGLAAVSEKIDPDIVTQRQLYDSAPRKRR